MPVIRTEATTADLLAAVAQLTTADLERFTEAVLRLRAARRVPHVPAEEAALLARINQAKQIERYTDLIAKRDAEQLTSDEYSELLRLTDVQETADAKRAARILALAQLRGTTPQQVINTLGLPPLDDSAAP